MTTFKYTCFISYRNGYNINDQPNVFSATFAAEISKTIQYYLPDSNVRDENGHNVFLDQHIFPNFAFDLQTLSAGLCKSIAWVILYSRDYFGESLWCASELEGMSRLEQKRLQHLEAENNPDIGFVIPVLIAGNPEEMPPFLRQRKNHMVDLRRLYLRPNFEKEGEFTDKLTDLLDKIGIVQTVVLNKKTDICASCPDFTLHDIDTEEGKNQIRNFITNIKTPPQPTV